MCRLQTIYVASDCGHHVVTETWLCIAAQAHDNNAPRATSSGTTSRLQVHDHPHDHQHRPPPDLITHCSEIQTYARITMAGYLCAACRDAERQQKRLLQQQQQLQRAQGKRPRVVQHRSYRKAVAAPPYGSRSVPLGAGDDYIQLSPVAEEVARVEILSLSAARDDMQTWREVSLDDFRELEDDVRDEETTMVADGDLANGVAKTRANRLVVGT